MTQTQQVTIRRRVKFTCFFFSRKRGNDRAYRRTELELHNLLLFNLIMLYHWDHTKIIPVQRAVIFTGVFSWYVYNIYLYRKYLVLKSDYSWPVESLSWCFRGNEKLIPNPLFKLFRDPFLQSFSLLSQTHIL